MTEPMSAPALAPPPPQPPPRTFKNDATKHLCAAAYLDREFRDRVIDEVYRREDRAIAPNPGTDAAPILRHVLKARTIDTAQQALLAGLLVIALCAGTTNLVALVVALVLWALIGLPVLMVDRGFTPPPHQRDRSPEARRKRTARQAGIAAIAVAVPVFLYSYLLGTGMVSPESGDLFEQFLGPQPGECVEYDMYGNCAVYLNDGTPGLASVVVWLIVFAAVTTTFGVVRRRALVRIPGEPEPQRPPTSRAAFIGMAQRAPVVNYHASRSPFVGSGQDVTTWQFALTLYPADRDGEGGPSPMAIDPIGLDDFIREWMAKLAHDTAITKRLPNLTLEDQVYVSGRDIDKPISYPSELPSVGYPQFQSVEHVQRDPTTPVRHYLRCEVDAWDGELVTTVFVHAALQGETLYVEFSSCILPPTPERYHVFGRGSASPGAAVFLGFLRGLALMPIELARSPFDTIRNIGRAGASRTGRRGEPEDHGAVIGVREIGTDEVEQNYFQFRDAVKYIEIMERQILDALVNYLHEVNVDTGELEERASAIVNNGVINYGQLNTGAAGAGASANVGAVGKGSRGTVKKGK
ncbi:hypothetical protein SAMN05216298_3894 [Glycomyces sambucus]|uniref:Uncharacterized protein n=1 Tax=Glycomyces sambucus TaxID=380244 RepID=A0A1G9K7B7_9ACTN|nr:hypothetical protein [Glycomyces sambucus]SDL45661.1 hypothetical protein SAMN05216298_3894 [Glycomyces sambucus]